MSVATVDCVEKALPGMNVAALRMHAPYHKCGEGFGKLFKRFWFKSCGPAMLLCYDTEYKDVANYEVAVPVKGGQSIDGIEVRELPAGRCVSLLHKGSYDQLAKSYDMARAYVAAKSHKLTLPSREIYIKGCGMIFRGNPNSYLTEIQLMLES